MSFAEEPPSGQVENIKFLEKFIDEQARDISTGIAYGTPDDRMLIDMDGGQVISLREDEADKESGDLAKYNIHNLIPEMKKVIVEDANPELTKLAIINTASATIEDEEKLILIYATYSGDLGYSKVQCCWRIDKAENGGVTFVLLFKIIFEQS